jgi:hypothetical protein
MTEGNVAIRPITAAALFQTAAPAVADPRIEHQLGLPQRPPYDDAMLARAIRDGVDASGMSLDDGMPRYALDAAAMKALLAYLRTLSGQPEPAVSETDIHLATVIQPGVSEQKRQAMLEVLTAFVRDKNAATRSDERRRQVGIMRMQRAYRHWQLHVWQLTGQPDSWGSQLEGYYRRQPVFAIVGGLGSADWTPIQDFSERFQVPCVFPQAVLADPRAGRFYTLYLWRAILPRAGHRSG